MKPYFSVVIPTYNRRRLLGSCLEGLSHQTFPASQFEVIVVDDGSTDGTKEFLAAAKYPFSLRCIPVENGGASRARNAGIDAAGGEVIALTEDDVLPERNWLERAYAHLTEESLEVLEGSTVYHGSGRGVRRFEHGGIPSFVPCNLFVRKDVFEIVGGYDPAFYDARRHLYFREDADLGFRMLDAGIGVALAEDAIVSHPAQFTTMRDCLRHGRRYYFDPLLYKKHPARFRHMIEVKRILGLRVHRPQHAVAWAYLVSLCVLMILLALQVLWAVVWPACTALMCSFLFRYKYQGWKAAKVYRLGETVGFLWAPLVYLGSVIRGCFAFRSFGAMV